MLTSMSTCLCFMNTPAASFQGLVTGANQHVKPAFAFVL